MGERPGGPDDVVAQLFDVAYRRLVVQLHGVCGDLTEAEEVVQEAFVRAVARGRRFAELENPEAWLRTVAVNQARSRHRRRRRGEVLHLVRERQADRPGDRSGASDAHVTLVAALRQLPAAQREAIALHHLADLPVTEVARTLGVPAGTVKARLSRGRTTLATRIGDDRAPVALVEGGDGATLFPLGRVHRSTDGGATWETVELQAGEQAYLGAGGVDATGRLVVEVVEWSGDEGVRGIHASDGRDWSSLPLTRRHPEGGWRELWMVATDEALEVRSIPDGVGVVEVSTDAGRTWERLAAQ